MYDSRSTALERPAAADKKDSWTLTEIWGEEIIGKKGDRGRGFTAIPNLLIHHLRLLDMDVTDVGILMAIWQHRRSPGEMPWPSKSTIAEDAGVDSERTVYSHLRRLDAMGFLTIHEHSGPNKRTHRYTTEGLERVLHVIAVNLNEEGKLTEQGRLEVEMECATLERRPFKPRRKAAPVECVPEF